MAVMRLTGGPYTRSIPPIFYIRPAWTDDVGVSKGSKEKVFWDPEMVMHDMGQILREMG